MPQPSVCTSEQGLALEMNSNHFVSSWVACCNQLVHGRGGLGEHPRSLHFPRCPRWCNLRALSGTLWGCFLSRPSHRSYCANRLSGSSQSAGLEPRIRIRHGECALSEDSYWNRHHYPEDISWRNSHLGSPSAALPSARVWPAPHATDTHDKTLKINCFVPFFFFFTYFNMLFLLFSFNCYKQRWTEDKNIILHI